MEHDIRDLQMVELDIAKAFVTICEKHHLRYFMLGGTLLGAIRHQGFIPWDDDMDLGMPRPDYEKFKRIAEKELPAPYRLDSFAHGGHYYYLRVINPTVKLWRTKGQKKTKIDVWIDIFPLDGAPDTKEELMQWNKNVHIKKRLYSYSQFDYFIDKEPMPGEVWSLKHKLILKFFLTTHIYKLISTKKAWHNLDVALQKYDYESASHLINYMGFWDIKEYFDKKYYGEGAYYTFEDIKLRGPVNYHAILTQMYGDYMTPPSDDMKDHHKIEFCDE